MPPHILAACGPRPQTNYTAALEAAGARVTSQYCPAYAPGYDALVLIGGGDVDPSLYGAENRGSEGIDRPRDLAEWALIDAFMAAGKPVLAICRGLQILNVALGGTLVQHIPGCEETHMALPDKTDRVHVVENEPDSLFFRLYGGRCAVNSYHHQGVDRLGRGLRAVQRAQDGVIEGVVHEERPVWAVQWHPERMRGHFLRPDAVDADPFFRALIRLWEGEA